MVFVSSGSKCARYMCKTYRKKAKTKPISANPVTFAANLVKGMKYFRTYPWLLQLLLFGLMVFTCISGATVIIYSLLPKLLGVLPSQANHITPASPPAFIQANLAMQAAINISAFSIPALLFAYLAHPRPGHYLGLRKPGKSIQPVLAILLVLGAMPLLTGLQSLISLIDFGPDVKAAQKANDDLFAALLIMPSFSSFLKVFLCLAIVPGIGEELFFRGLLMRFAAVRSRTIAGPILFSALIFAFSHSNIYGFLSIFLAGALLGFLYHITGSIWCNILAHIVFNGTQTILSYLAAGNKALKNFLDGDISIILILCGAVVFSLSLYLLLKNRTPLPANWTDDFAGEQRTEEELN